MEAIQLAGVNTITHNIREDRIILTAQVGRNLRQIYMTTCLATFTFYGRTLGLHDKASCLICRIELRPDLRVRCDLFIAMRIR